MKRIQSIPTVIALLALAACSSQPVNSVESTQPGRELYEKVVFSNQLDRKVKIGYVQKDVVDGFLRVQVDLENTQRDKTTFHYAFEWFDEGGMQVATTTSIWTEATIFPGETRSFLATSGNTAATDFRFKVKQK